MIEQISGDFLQWLRGFYYVAARGGVTQAANAMGQAQSTVTRQIKCLEREMGETLFDRSSGHLRLTPAGDALFERAIVLFDVVKEIKSGSRDIGFQGKVNIAVSRGLTGASFLPEVIAKFRKAHPQVVFDVASGGFDMVLESVKSGVADFGICYNESPNDAVTFHELSERGMMLLTKKGSRFPAGKSPTLEEIAKTPLILLSRVEPFIAQRFAQTGLQPYVVLTSDSPISVKQAVSAGVGIALLGELSITREDDQLFEIYNVNRFFPKRTYGLLLRKGKHLAPHVKAFLREIKPGLVLAGERAAK